MIKYMSETEFNMAIGVLQIKGHVYQPFYILDNLTLKFVKEIDSYLVSEIDRDWQGPPIRLDVDVEKGEINFVKLLDHYSKSILSHAYSYVTDDDIYLENPDKDIVITITDFPNKNLEKGLSLKGYIEMLDSSYAIEFQMNLLKLSETPMEKRYATPKIGYFHLPIEIITDGLECKSTGCPSAIIQRLNLAKAPWNFAIHKSVPKNYIEAVKNGVLSWNSFFKKLGLSEPFQVSLLDSDDIFNMGRWTIINSQARNFNATHSGHSGVIYDYRSGENLYGLIDLNLVKISTYPIRHIFLTDQKDNIELMDKYVQVFITWVTAHEVGHQLGLRHNFMGNLQNDSLGSIMDYIDVFSIQHINPLEVDFTSTSRKYDLDAIEFGYCTKCDVAGIIKNFKEKFGTDENDYELHPDVIKFSDNSDAFQYIKKSIAMYTEYRKNLIEEILSDSISSYEYAELLIYVYTNKYMDLIRVCLKFIGSKQFDINRKSQEPTNEKDTVSAVEMIGIILEHMYYSYDEYKYFVHHFKDDFKYYEFNRIEIDSFYDLNTLGLDKVYPIILKDMFSEILLEDRLINLTNDYSNYKLSDYLETLTFKYIIKDESKNITSQEKIMLSLWVESLVNKFQDTSSYLVKDAILKVLEEVKLLSNLPSITKKIIEEQLLG